METASTAETREQVLAFYRAEYPEVRNSSDLIRLAVMHRNVREALAMSIQPEGEERTSEELRQARIDPMSLILSFFSQEG